jgi:hypothetical protein
MNLNGLFDGFGSAANPKGESLKGRQQSRAKERGEGIE